MRLKPAQRHLLQSIADHKGKLLAVSASGQLDTLKLMFAWGLVVYSDHPDKLNASRRRPALALSITDKGRARLAERQAGEEGRLPVLIGQRSHADK